MDDFLNNENNENNVFESRVIEMPSLMSKVFMWLFVAIAISGITAFIVSVSETLIKMIYLNPIVLIVLVISELLLVIILSRKISTISYTTAIVGFIAYSIINGLTLSCIFFVYELGSIATVFFITAVLFGVMALIGYKTNIDLTRMGNLLFCALFGIIVAGIVNIFLGNTMLDLVICVIGIVVFVGLTAYDVQKIKQLSETCSEEQFNNLSILGALTIYLDFINLFLKILALIGKRKN